MFLSFYAVFMQFACSHHFVCLFSKKIKIKKINKREDFIFILLYFNGSVWYGGLGYTMKCYDCIESLQYRDKGNVELRLGIMGCIFVS